MAEETYILDLDDREVKRRFLTRLGAVSGRWEVTMKPWKPRRSNRANSFYWISTVSAFREFLRAQGENYSLDECHELIKTRVLGTQKVVDKNTGEVIGELPKRSSTLNTNDFCDFVERARLWLYETFGIITQDPAPLVNQKGAA